MRTKKIEFPNLNGLRFLAAFAVVVHHIEQVKNIYGFQNLWANRAILALGWHGVTLFFVLSGFLITYLLLEEKEQFCSISIGKFYVRRVLRIWPLYFILVILSFGILPAFSLFDVPNYWPVWSREWWKPLLLYTVLSPHVSEIWLWQIPFAGVLWSVGVEEWFYLIWPWIVKQERRLELLFLIGIIIALFVMRILASGNISSLLGSMRFDCMAIGGLLSMLLRAKERPSAQFSLALLFHPAAQLTVYAVLAVLIGQGQEFHHVIKTLIYGFLYGLVVLNLAGNPRSIVRLETPALNWLGNLSYGMYCYNWITTVAAVKIILWSLSFGFANTVNLSLQIYALCIILLIVISGLSYEFVERRLLLLKQRAYTLLPNISPTSMISLSRRVQN